MLHRLNRRPNHILTVSALIIAIASTVSACNSGKVAQARPIEIRPAVAVLGQYSFVGTEPSNPLDETPITPVETAGASAGY